MNADIMESLSSHKISIVALSFLAYFVCEVVFRLYFSPVAKFPGPRLAAASFWYEFYYDVVLGGRYTWKLAELHKEYGIRDCFLLQSDPILLNRSGAVVRINPYELHINDPEFYDEIYVGPTKGKTDKWFWSVRDKRVAEWASTDLEW